MWTWGSHEEGVDPVEQAEDTADVLADSSSDEAGEAAGAAAGADSSDEEAAGNEGGGEDEDEYEGGVLDSSDEEENTAGSVARTIGNAVAPVGYKIIDECPLLTTELQKNEMIGIQHSAVWLGLEQRDGLVRRYRAFAQFVRDRSQEGADGKLRGQVYRQHDRRCDQW